MTATLPSQLAIAPADAPWLASHPFITFECNLEHLSPVAWTLLGECSSKIDHIINVSLKPTTALHLLKIFVAKGIHGTAAIEGNTLSELQVKQRVEGELRLPASQAYLGQEIDNIVKAYNELVIDQLEFGPMEPVTATRLKAFNRQVLEGLELSADVVPGEYRDHVVGVNDYHSPSPLYTEELVDRLCTWMRHPTWRAEDEMPHFVRPTLQAIIAHLYFAWIHPFGDGNGRAARLLEFDILTRAGVPPMCAHVLADHYNKTRTEYYRALSRARGDCMVFIRYSVQGFVDGLREQLALIWQEQQHVAWVNYVHGAFKGEPHSTPSDRRRRVAIALAEGGPLTTEEIASSAPNLPYVRDPRILSRDMEKLMTMGLVTLRRDGKYAATVDSLRSMKPFYRDGRRDVEEKS